MITDQGDKVSAHLRRRLETDDLIGSVRGISLLRNLKKKVFERLRLCRDTLPDMTNKDVKQS